jgi:segregation and condensation protein B
VIDPECDIGGEEGEGIESRDFQAELEAERIAEALVFASSQPVSEAFIADRIA